MRSSHRALAWLRRDLRLADNRVLATATATSERVWPVFVADDELRERHSVATGRMAWFGANVRELDRTLRAHGSGLTVLSGRPEEVLPAFAAAVGAERIVAAADEDPAARARDRRVADRVTLDLVEDQRIVPPGDLRTAQGEAYGVFTPFRRALEARLSEDSRVLAEAVLIPERLAPPPAKDAGQFPAVAPPHQLPPAGERAAAARLAAFGAERMRQYHEDRDLPAAGGTSGLSPYLRVGALSVRACWRAAGEAERRAAAIGDRQLARSVAAWRGELAWREFFGHVLAAHPRLATESYRREYDTMEWTDGREADDLLAAWRAGRTGFPFVDAGMRELAATGWMHNRARLVAASFLVKDAGLDWRRGQAVFDELLLDADLQQNGGNWQWVAGVGTDAAPYFRIFNPVLQSRKFDPHGIYLRRWLPELGGLPDEHLHEPWRAPTPAPDYPVPILDHAQARERSIARYGDARRGGTIAPGGGVYSADHPQRTHR